MDENPNKEKNKEGQDDDNQEKEIFPGYQSFDDFTKAGYKTLMEAIRNSNSLPSGRDWNFYNTFEPVTNILNSSGDKIMSDISLILRKNDLRSNMRLSTIEHQTELLIEANDVIFERVANNIDEMNGIRKTVNEPVVLQTVSAYLPINGSWNRLNSATFSVTSSTTTSGLVQPADNNAKTIRLLTAENIIRPQKFFKDVINNSNKSPWEPRIKEKPNSLKPLAIFLEESEIGEEFSHPYETELDHFTPSPELLQKQTVSIPQTVEETPLIEIKTPQQLNELVETLRGFKEIAVDLEHHSYRSFMGITCLMQISTKEKDYLIDTLALRDKLYVLNEVFTKPSIVKIFHGAAHDIQWLQRDLSLYVVNMFDTYIAAKLLNYSTLSLASLMQRFCNFMPNKQFQLADWRIRPLPEELKLYAREDTHYLIYIYQMMKNELIHKANGQNNLVKAAFQQSVEVCKKRYFKPILREDSHLEFYRRCNRLFDNRQLYALKHLYKWRDEISREEDESTGYVLPNNMLLEISERLPKEMQGILACCNPVPPLVRASLLDLHKIILKALEQPFEEPILKEDIRARGTTKKVSKINIDSPLYCPHDLTKTTDFPDHLPTLLDSKHDFLSLESGKIEANVSKCSVFNTPENSDNEAENKAQKDVSFKFLGPYERYKLVKPFIKAREEKLAAEKEKGEENKEVPPSEPNLLDDTRTDEERIESIKQHFLNLLHQVPPEPVSNTSQKSGEVELQEKSIQNPPAETSSHMSLREMGGTSKKRKRSRSRSQDNSLTSRLSNLYDSCVLLDNLHNPVPKFDRKRKSSPQGNSATPEKMPRRDPESSNKKRPGNKWQKNKNQNNQQRGKNNKNRGADNSTPRRLQQDFEDSEQGQRNSGGKHNRGGHKQQRGQNNHSRGGNNGGRGGQNYNRGGYNNKGNQSRGGQHNRNRGNPNNQSQNDESFSAYDYASVDFRQFQGGAGGVNAPKQIKSKFKGKNKNKNANRGQNRMQSFRGGR